MDEIDLNKVEGLIEELYSKNHHDAQLSYEDAQRILSSASQLVKKIKELREKINKNIGG
ncbi:hypothetical protein [Alicyclobacillus acidoterrestris]|uniref:Uncharacterized protein n=1 Tax=Alicyclobacillus acidoterrestris (strain ATCC 49025 / DSM 3922 / CIP 106132 / NCIMB 13137 / GD3B) TaxID=1356854 RepID=T0DDF4_ALIAG|nr:hypothetical protein [Alicyclobacillus acidoterrestris]EPZ47691.1 hypothetical protein N007_05405 [Alicyclobacillus acidoterrestris ATCC 49025]UNO47993.1 hypothetical protein K1I37_15065 [Alicyclobacillus acidoterrestris]